MASSSLPETRIEQAYPSLPHRLTQRTQHPWTKWDAYLFDVDGTLLRSLDRVHVSAFSEAVAGALGHAITLDGVTLHGGTDTAILAEACANAGINPDLLAVHTDAILHRMAEIVERKQAELRFCRMPGVPEILAVLQQAGALLGLATGNLERIGWAKIDRCGLREWFTFGGFSDRYPDRAELVWAAAERARKMLGNSMARICVVGDTPRDIQAAHENGLEVIAVATGNYGFDELDACAPDICCSSFPALMHSDAEQLR